MSSEIPLRDRAGEVLAYVQVDPHDFEALSEWAWSLSTPGYPYRKARVGGKNVYIAMHRQIMGLIPGERREVDHINGDSLDNRRSNLRLCSHAENHQNHHGGYGKSNHRGVAWHRGAEKWRAYATISGTQHHLGLFVTEDEARAAAEAFRAERMPFSKEAAA